MIADKDTAGTSGQRPTSSAVLSAIQRMGSEVSASLLWWLRRLRCWPNSRNNPGQSPWGEQVSPRMQSHPQAGLIQSHQEARNAGVQSKGKDKARQHEDTDV